MNLVKVTDLEKIYNTGDISFAALKGVSLELAEGDFMAVMGHSGSGKSTLLHMIGGLDYPTAGSVQVGEYLLTEMNILEHHRTVARLVEAGGKALMGIALLWGLVVLLKQMKRLKGFGKKRALSG